MSVSSTAKVWKTIILGIIFIGLLVFVYLYEIKGGREREAMREKELDVFPYTPQQVESFELDGGFGPIKAERDSVGNWIITSPVEYGGDEQKIDEMLKTLADAEWGRTILDSTDDLSPYGLSHPKISLDIQLKDGNIYALRLGNSTPLGENVYAKYPDSNRVALLKTSLQGVLRRKLYDLRDKDILTFNQAEIEKVRLERGENKPTVVLTKPSGASWKLLEPITDDANQSFVSGMLSNLTTMRAQSFPSEDTTGFQKFGFEKPQAKIEFTLRTGEKQILLIGNTRPDNEKLYYVFTPSKKPVFEVQKAMVEKVFEPVKEFRSLQLVDLKKVDEVEFKKDTVGYILKKADDQWMLTVPEQLSAKREQVNKLLSDFRAPKGIASFLEDTIKVGKDSYVKFTSYHPDTSQRVVYFEQKNDTTTLAKVEGRQGIFQVKDNIASWLDRDYQYFVDKRLFTPTMSQLSYVEYSDSMGNVYKLEADKDGWELVEPDKKDIPGNKRWDILNAIKGIEYQESKSLEGEELAELGLQSPVHYLIVEEQDGKQRKLLIGNTKEGHYYTRIQGENKVYMVDRYKIKKLSDILEELGK